MPKKQIITIQDVKKPLDVHVFSDLKTACSRMGMSWSYDWLRNQKLPYLYKGTYYINRAIIKYAE